MRLLQLLNDLDHETLMRWLLRVWWEKDRQFVRGLLAASQ